MEKIIEEKNGFELLKIAKTNASCTLCEDFCEDAVKTHEFAIASCDGACIRGEISRRMANIIAYELAPDKYARICLGSAITKDSGQRNLLRSLKNLIVIEGCSLKCASRMIDSVVSRADMKVFLIDSYCSFDPDLFAINELSSLGTEDIAQKGAANFMNKMPSTASSSCCG